MSRQDPSECRRVLACPAWPPALTLLRAGVVSLSGERAHDIAPAVKATTVHRNQDAPALSGSMRNVIPNLGAG